VFAQCIPLLGQVEDDILRCLERGGGVPYERYGRFHEVMAEDSAQTVVAALQAHVLPLVPDLIGDLERGIEVLDIGCGSGRALIAMASAYPNSRFTGYGLITTSGTSSMSRAWPEAGKRPGERTPISRARSSSENGGKLAGWSKGRSDECARGADHDGSASLDSP
jgi:SAM-dependent methyltransferase